jgi:hypothetical protein
MFAKAVLASTAADLDATYAKIAKRIVPFMVLLFLTAWLDRYNLGFAKLQSRISVSVRQYTVSARALSTSDTLCSRFLAICSSNVSARARPSPALPFSGASPSWR